MQEKEYFNEIAIIGMAGCFPGARNIDEFWQNLIGGKDSITRYSYDELLNAGIDKELLDHPQYVRAKGELEDIGMFDADFFGINPKDAELIDPQHRLLLQCAYHALEDAGYDSNRYKKRIGIYAGCAMNFYLLMNVFPHMQAKTASLDTLQASISNDKDSLTTTISYYMNLRGPAVTVQTSSSTSLVSVCMACQSLLSYQCDMVLAGGIAAVPLQKSGYLFEEGGIVSPDGYCRPFDENSKGFVPGYGMGLVVLKRLQEAMDDNDHIYAIIKGFAVNNDGSQKVSYSAPSVDAQSEVIIEACAIAGISAQTIDFIEAHGTATSLGDPIEIAALTKAFRATTDKKQFCAIGSVKGNIGHLDTAGGVAGLIKASLSLKHGMIPPSIHYEKANPQIDFENSPFYVINNKQRLNPENKPNRAGVSSLGMGGTNAHVVLEEAPIIKPSGQSRPCQIMTFSSYNENALNTLISQYYDFLKIHKKLSLPDAAYTMQTGRRVLNCRKSFTCRSHNELLKKMENYREKNEYSFCTDVKPKIVFLFPGQGTQYVNMGIEIYRQEEVFRSAIDNCANYLNKHLNKDIQHILFPGIDQEEEAKQLLFRTEYAQPVLFIFEYALAKLWMHWGIMPESFIGYCLGEYTAACLSGVMTLEDALFMITARSQLMHQTEQGKMLVVGCNGEKLSQLIGDHLDIAAINTPELCVIAGKEKEITKMIHVLEEKKIFFLDLKTNSAFHSRLMDPILEQYAQLIKDISFQPPQIPFISSVSGTWVTKEQACDPGYWVEHLRKAILFSQGLDTLTELPGRFYLEAGPGNDLITLLGLRKKSNIKLFQSLPRHDQKENDLTFLLETLARLWEAGFEIRWENFYEQENRSRISLPLYPFERQLHWLGSYYDKDDNKIKEQRKDKQSSSQEVLPQPKQNEWKSLTVEGKKDPGLIIRRVWQVHLGMDSIGDHENFFDLGGTSILLAKIYNELNLYYPDQLMIVDLFNYPTIALLSGYLNEKINEVTQIQNQDELLLKRKKALQDRSSIRKGLLES